MRRMIGTAFVLGILMASASPAKAQFGLSISGPYRGGYGYPGGYSGYGYAPTSYAYNSAYVGFAPRVYAPPVYAAPVYMYPSVRTYGYAYPGYGYGGRGRGRGYRRW